MGDGFAALWPAWLFVALALAVPLTPTAAGVRVEGLAGRGRLLGRPPGRRWLADVRARLPSAAGGGAPMGTNLLGGTVLGWAVVGAAALGVGAVAGPALALAAVAVLGTAALLVRDVVRARHDFRRQRELLAAVRILAGELTAGSRPAAALAAAAGTGPAAALLFGPAATAAGRGDDAATLLIGQGEPAVRAVGVAWRLGETTGAGLADVIERVASDLADRDTQRRTVAVALAGPRSSAMLLSGLPVLGIGLGAAMGASPGPFLLDDPAGRLLCCAGVLLDAAGLLWMRRIVARAKR